MKSQTVWPALGLIGCLLGALLCAGCKTSVNTVERAEPTSQRQMLSDKRIITDPGLNRKVWVVGVNEALTAGGLLKVQVEVQATGSSVFDCGGVDQWLSSVHSSSPCC